MTKASIIEKGELFNISFDNKKVVSGWLLLLTQENEEYLIRQNSGLLGFGNYKIKREVYKANIEFKSKIISKDEMKKNMKKKSERNFIGISTGMILSAILRHNIDKDWIFGAINFPVNIATGIFNLVVFWSVFVLTFFLVSTYRKRKFLSTMNRLCDGSLVLFGKGYERNAVKKRLNNIKYLFPLLGLLVVTVFIMIMLPFFVQERLFALLITIIVLLLFFNGNTVLNKKISEYLIMRMEK